MSYSNLKKFRRTVDLLAREGGITISGLEQELGVSRRSVYRMRGLLEELNFPVYDDRRPLEREIFKLIVIGFFSLLCKTFEIIIVPIVLTVRCIFEHLPDNFTSRPCIFKSLTFHKSWYCILISEKEVH